MTALEIVLSILCLFLMFITGLVGFFAVKLFKAAEAKTKINLDLIDLILTMSQYTVQNTRFLEGELARNIGNSDIPSYMELKSGLGDLREKISLFSSVAEEIKVSMASSGI